MKSILSAGSKSVTDPACGGTAGSARKLIRSLALATVAGCFAATAWAQDLTPSITTRGDGKTVATFSDVGSGTWTIPAGVTEVEILVVGGGGSGAAGGTWNADGGGAGGLHYSSSHPVTGGDSVTITVGAGGAALSSDGAGNNGSDSVFGQLIAQGGEGGLSSRGGNQGGYSTTGGAPFTTGFAGATNDGSNGGGGAGGAGAGAFGASPGGIGAQVGITGTPTYFAGGGGGGYSGGNNAGGLGGGGKGATDGEAGFGHDGVNGLGGGGGASRDHPNSGGGGSGVVIVAYAGSASLWTVDFDSNGGSAVTGQSVPDGGMAAPPTPPTRAGYTFGEWFSDIELTTPFDFNNTITADTTLYAQWVINSHTLTYIAGSNGTIDGTLLQTVEYGGSGSEVIAVPDTAYQFARWSDDSTANPRTDTAISADISVTAIFEAIPLPISPTTVTTRSDGYTVATFSDVGSGIWTIPAGVTAVEVLVVGGGGGGAAGGTWSADGGGAGGLYYNSNFSVTDGGSVTITVGAGGAARSSYGAGNNGIDSVFGQLNAQGGEGGLSIRGGNQGGYSTTGGAPITTGFAGATNEGSNGGGGAGGTGAGAFGASPGGIGAQVGITGTPTYYAGGGGGGYSGDNNAGGLGGGGKGATDGEAGFGHNGVDGLGGGGGASRDNPNSGAGGSGVVIVAYLVESANPYADWVASIPGFTTSTDPGLDPDGDGMSNQNEFAFGLNPTKGDSVNPIVVPLDKASHTFSYTRLANSGLAYTVWISPDLEDWGNGPVAVSEVVTSTVEGVETVGATLIAPPVVGRLFLRVQADETVSVPE